MENFTHIGAEEARALAYCRERLGWARAFLPTAPQREAQALEAGIVYEYAPAGFFDTPGMFAVQTMRRVF